MEYKIALIPGDGIGPEIVAEAKKVLDRVCEKYSHKFSYTEVLLGGASIDAHGVPLTEEAIAQAKASDAVLMGSIGGDAKTSPWYKLEPSKRPEAGLLAIRKALNLFANLRPAYLYNELRDACPLRDEIIGDGFDMIIVRELTGGLYFGARKTTEENGVRTAVDTLSYNENEIRRIAIKAFEIARKRRNKVTSVDKANVLDSSRLHQIIFHAGRAIHRYMIKTKRTTSMYCIIAGLRIIIITIAPEPGLCCTVTDICVCVCVIQPERNVDALNLADMIL